MSTSVIEKKGVRREHGCSIQTPTGWSHKTKKDLDLSGRSRTKEKIKIFETYPEQILELFHVDESTKQFVMGIT